MQLVEITINMKPGETLQTVIEVDGLPKILKNLDGEFLWIVKPESAKDFDVPDMLIVRIDEILDIEVYPVDDEKDGGGDDDS